MNSFFKNDRVAFFSIITLSLILMFGKSMNFEAQEGVLSGFLSRYVEETALASVIEPSQNDIAEINSVYTQPNGTGGNDIIDPVTMQANSLLSYNSVLEDISSEFPGEGHEIASYTVQDGDTISFIASDFGVSVNTIVWANNLSSVDQIKPGMELKIPPVTGVIHKITSGDTVASIAKKYGVEAESIVSFNHLSQDDDLQVDEEIIVPDGKIQAPVAPKAAPGSKTVKRFANLPNLGGYFSLPVTGGRNWGRIHGRNGVDVANSCGTPIYAAADGVVNMAKASGYNGGFGKFIRITHPNGTETLYAHASQVLVAVGQRVSRGTQIALMGTTGRSTGCHVHFEVHGAKNPLAR